MSLLNDYALKDKTFISPELNLYNYFVHEKYKGAGATNGLDIDDADYIDLLLKEHKLWPSIQVDRKLLKESHEAWVYVQVTGDDPAIAHNCSRFAGFEPCPRIGVLTWCNSD